INVRSITVDPNFPRTIYVGTGEGFIHPLARPGTGILKSTDGGNTWQVFTGPNNSFVGLCVPKIVVDPRDSSRVWAPAFAQPGIPGNRVIADNNGLYRTLRPGEVDQGQSGWRWTRLPAASGVAGNEMITDLDYTQTAPNQLALL